MIRVGPAGWSYPDWDSAVYPRYKPTGFHPLPYLARFMDCIEVNSSFYAMPREEHVVRWVRHVADRAEFRFAVKLLQDFTHGPHPGQDSGDWDAKAAQFKAAIDPLRRARKLGALLVQFPIQFIHGPVEVRRLGHLAKLFAGYPLVLEVRHSSWFEPPARSMVSGLGFSLAHIDLPESWNHPPAWHPPSGPIGYLRLHGRNAQDWFRSGAGRDDRYNYLYDERELDALAGKARRLAGVTDTTYVITNNHFGGQAVANGIELKFLLSGERQMAPPELLECFPRLERVADSDGQQRLF